MMSTGGHGTYLETGVVELDVRCELFIRCLEVFLVLRPSLEHSL